MQIDQETLSQVAQDLLATMLGFEVTNCPNPHDTGLAVTSSLNIVGNDSYKVTIYAPYITASVIASRIFRLSPKDIDEGLILDAIGEVANIIGGNVKGILNGEYSLTIPQSIMVACMERPEDSKTVEVVVGCDGMPLQVCLTEESAVAV